MSVNNSHVNILVSKAKLKGHPAHHKSVCLQALKIGLGKTITSFQNKCLPKPQYELAHTIAHMHSFTWNICKKFGEQNKQTDAVAQTSLLTYDPTKLEQTYGFNLSTWN